MKCFASLYLTALLIAPTLSQAETSEGVLMRCGASSGHSYFFHDKVFNPDGPMWDKDGIRNGKILLVRLGDEWDIQFDDIAGASGYRQDGAKVIPLSEGDGKLTVGAFGKQYTEIYTFDFVSREVAWSSHKVGLIPKVALYRASCE